MAGRPTELTEELLVKIKNLVIEGKLEKEIAEEISVPYDTFAGWKKRNFDNFADLFLSYEHERKLRKAERKLEVLVDSDNEKVALGASTFIAETLGRKHYSKRTEADITSKGEKITVDPTRANEIAKKYEEELKESL